MAVRPQVSMADVSPWAAASHEGGQHPFNPSNNDGGKERTGQSTGVITDNHAQVLLTGLKAFMQGVGQTSSLAACKQKLTKQLSFTAKQEKRPIRPERLARQAHKGTILCKILEQPFLSSCMVIPGGSHE